MKILIPSNIDLELFENEIKSRYPKLNQKILNKHFEYMERCLILFHRIYIGCNANRRRYYLKKDISLSDCKWVQISSQFTQTLFSSTSKSIYSYTDFIDYLRKEFIEYKPYIKHGKKLDLYIVGKLCKQVKFINSSNYEEYDLVTKGAKRMYKKLFVEKELLSKSLNSEELEFRSIANNNAKELRLLDNDLTRKVLNLRINGSAEYSAQEYLNSFNENFYPNVIDSFGYRLHTKVTSLNKELFSELRYKNQAVSGIDIANSQPYFSAILNDHVIDALFGRDRWSFLRQVKQIYSQYRNEIDFIEYKKQCVTGNLYEYLQEQIQIKSGKFICRDYIKKIYMKIAYSNYDKPQVANKKYFELFRSVFPSVYNLFKDLKSFEFGCKSIKKGDYTNNSLFFQRCESFFCFSFLAKRLIERGIWFTTIHDSIVCLKQDQIQVKEEFLEAFSDLGIQPPKLTFK